MKYHLFFQSNSIGTYWRNICWGHLISDDMVNWKDHGEILNSSQVDWGRPEGGFMWAPDCAYKNGKYYTIHLSTSNRPISFKATNR